MIANTIADFWWYVRKSRGCWLWLGERREPYGRFTFCGKKYSAHRFSYSLIHGPIPSNLKCCHSCDNPLCVKPDHLFIGTHQDNMNDCTTKNRQARGVKKPWAKLTDQKVKKIRSEYVKRFGEYCLVKNLAKEFKVSSSTISNVIARRVWQHV